MKRAASLLWALVVAFSVAFSCVRLKQGRIVDTSLLSLLPATEGDPLLADVNDLLSRRASRLMAFVVDTPDASRVEDVGDKLKDELRASGFVRNFLTDVSADQQKAFYDLYFPSRYQMLSSADRERMKTADPLAAFTRRLTEALYSPAASFLKDLIPRDPFLFFPELLHSWMETAAPRRSSSSALAAVELSVDPFDAKEQDRMMNWIAGVKQRLAATEPGARLSISGVLPFAVAERRRTEREITFVSIGSLLGVLLLTAAVFASPRAILVAAIPITAGFFVAVASTILIFGRIHIITFAFGSSLIGVAIDYPLLYLAHHRLNPEEWDAGATLRRVSPGLLFGALTTLAGYAALCVAPFPGLRQMAVFSSTGLAAALISVLLWLPPLLAKASTRAHEPRLLRAGQRLLEAMRRFRGATPRSKQWAAIFIFMLFLGGGLARLSFNDDIRLLQNPPRAVAEEDARVRKASGGVGGDHFILVRGATVEELLQRQEILQERLRRLLADGTISSIQSLAPFLPSRRQQEEDRARLKDYFLSNAKRARSSLASLGLASDVADRFLSDLKRPVEFLSLERWLQSPASEMLRSLWIGTTAHGVASAVLVGGEAPSTTLQSSLKDVPGALYFDQTEAYSALFHRYRRFGTALIFAAYLAVWAVMMLRYGARVGTWVVAPSVGAVLFTFAIFGWLKIPVHLIHCLSALLVLSMGVDYAIYFAESSRREGMERPTILAVELCAGATLISFGLLALCRTPVLSAIGLTVFIGLAFAFLFSPLPVLERAS